MRVLAFVRTVITTLVVVAFFGLGGALLWDWATNAPMSGVPITARLAPVVSRLEAAAPLIDPACYRDKAFEGAASDNRIWLDTEVVSPFGLPETGWAIYAPLAAHEIGTPCAPQSRAFAAALAKWQGAHSLPASGRMDAATLSSMATKWLLDRPFVRAMPTGCPASPNEATLAKANPDEAYGGKLVEARPGALDAYRRMVAAARTEIGVRPPILSIASAYRGPTEEAARCADGSCGNPAKAHCSAHRTGLAFDLYLGGPPGKAFSTASEDRLALARGLPYHWLVNNAGRFGFVSYPYEPWHWEWTGEPVTP